MRIVIDLQGAQTESRFRGIGRYSLSLALAIARNRGQHEVIIALNGLLTESIESIRTAFDQLLPQENIRVWKAPGPVRQCDVHNELRRKSAEIIREGFLSSLQPDIILLTSLFEGYVDDAVTSIGEFDTSSKTAVILYDLIPFVDPNAYLQTDIQREYYFRKIEALKNADLMLSISESTKQQAMQELGLSSENIKTIFSAVDEKFCFANLSSDEKIRLKARYSIDNEFVMYAPGGFDSRKNIEGLILAYGMLPKYLRSHYQLVIASRINDYHRTCLLALSRKAGLSENELILVGYVSDNDLISLYRVTELFIFPSLSEGFGLPVLEAMSCGAATIGSNATSIPEVIGNQNALFEPTSISSISEKLEEVLQNDQLKNDLSKAGLEQAQKFSWDKSAKLAIVAFENKVKSDVTGRNCVLLNHRPRLAFISPLPAERSGIADYSAELIPALSKYYKIDVIVVQTTVTDQWIRDHCGIRSPEYFLENAQKYERVLYHFGNSIFHQYMYPLINKIPGTVCLHDFYLSGYSRYLECVEGDSYLWAYNLYLSHGYRAVRDRFHLPDDEIVMYKYPCNLAVLQAANGVIVHSCYSKRLSEIWYGKKISENWVVIPLLRQTKEINVASKSRELCGIPEDSFVICSFGLLDATKLNHRLLSAWLASSLSGKTNCYLVFVGENHAGEYGRSLYDKINESSHKDQIRITGWVSTEVFQAYLNVTDIAVQLRTHSRGETSAAVLDCMNNGLPLITNANGSVAELPADSVWMLDDEFEDNDLIYALETLWESSKKRQALSRKAKEVVEKYHSPEACAKQYAVAIEGFYHSSLTSRNHLISRLANNFYELDNDDYLKHLASCIDHNQPDKKFTSTIFIDVTAISQCDLKTGIERVTRALMLQFVNEPPDGYRVEPVYLSNKDGVWIYRYARSFTLGLLECPNDWINDDVIDLQSGDIILAADVSGVAVSESEKGGVYKRLRDIGVRIIFIVYDLLPIKFPEFFPKGADSAFKVWLSSVCRVSDQIICISKVVADELNEWCQVNTPLRPRKLNINWFHLGADIKRTAPSTGIPLGAEKRLKTFTTKPTFLMVGTIEPRKGHLSVIEAFERLWASGCDVNLVIVGNEGWRELADSERRSIPVIMKKIQSHSKLDESLFFEEEASDEYLENIYASSTCLIAASENEGFGLPLIEAAMHNLPIIAHDIPVFREVAGENAFYYKSGVENLTQSIFDWIALYKEASHPKSGGVLWLTWKESSEQLFQRIVSSSIDGEVS